MKPGWENFFVSAAGAAAALSGLVFVAVSINLQRILESPSLPARAAETLMVFMGVLVVATCGLVPDQSLVFTGLEIGGAGLFIWIAAVQRQVKAHRHPDLEPQARRWLWARVLAVQAATVPFVISGCLLVAHRESGMLWAALGTVGSFIAGAFNAWVLLFEIQRGPPLAPVNSETRP